MIFQKAKIVGANGVLMLLITVFRKFGMKGFGRLRMCQAA